MSTEYNNEPISNAESPWGRIQQTQRLADGIVEVVTASHGGVWLSAERLAQMPPSHVSLDGWYEEDVEVLFPLHAFIDEVDFGVEPAAHQKMIDSIKRGFDRLADDFRRVSMDRRPTDQLTQARVDAAKELRKQAETKQETQASRRSGKRLGI